MTLNYDINKITRDPNSQAVIIDDHEGYQAARIRQQKRQEMNQMKTDIDDLKAETKSIGSKLDLILSALNNSNKDQ